MCSRAICEAGSLEPEPDVEEVYEVPDPLPDAAPFSHLVIPSREELRDGALVFVPLDEVAIALGPSSNPSAVAAWLRFGAFYGCPRPCEHVRLWLERYGAEVFGMTNDRIELVVRRPPSDPADVLELTRLQCSYSDELESYSLAEAFARLIGARVWPFWWD